jgi:hypothetical protein
VGHCTRICYRAPLDGDIEWGPSTFSSIVSELYCGKFAQSKNCGASETGNGTTLAARQQIFNIAAVGLQFKSCVFCVVRAEGL